MTYEPLHMRIDIKQKNESFYRVNEFLYPGMCF